MSVSPNVVVQAFGTHSALATLGEQLAWLGAACRQSDDETIKYALPSIIATPGFISFKIVFDLINLEVRGNQQLVDGSCWHSLFWNPVIVKGFPILNRGT